VNVIYYVGIILHRLKFEICITFLHASDTDNWEFLILNLTLPPHQCSSVMLLEN